MSEPHKDAIDDMLAEDRKAQHKKHRITKRIFGRIVAEPLESLVHVWLRDLPLRIRSAVPGKCLTTRSFIAKRLRSYFYLGCMFAEAFGACAGNTMH